MFSPAISNLPFILFSIFLISDIVVFISKSLIEDFFISFVSLFNMTNHASSFLNMQNTIIITVLMSWSINSIICVSSEAFQ